ARRSARLAKTGASSSSGVDSSLPGVDSAPSGVDSSASPSGVGSSDSGTLRLGIGVPPDVSRCGWTVAGIGRLGQVRIAYSADDENDTTRAVVRYLSEQGHHVVSVTDSDKWPDIGAAVGAAVVAGEADYGVVLCWTGTGTAIAANKVPGVRAALAWE